MLHIISDSEAGQEGWKNAEGKLVRVIAVRDLGAEPLLHRNVE
jgi:hypothetical protein